MRATLSRGSLDVLRISRPTRAAWEELQLSEEARDKKPHSLGIMMRSFVDACLHEKLNGDVDASFHDGLAAQQALAAVIEANSQLRWMPLKQVV